jgi:hypothetical protein
MSVDTEVVPMAVTTVEKPMTIWTNKTYEITSRWGEGATLWLTPASGKKTEFKLHHVNKLPSVGGWKGPGYLVTFNDGCMHKVWKHAWLYESAPVSATQVVEHTKGDPGLIPGRLADVMEPIPCITGFMPVDYKQDPRLDYVTMYYLSNVNPGQPYPDLIVIIMGFADISPGDQVIHVLEDGAASGPPK